MATLRVLTAAEAASQEAVDLLAARYTLGDVTLPPARVLALEYAATATTRIPVFECSF